MERNKTLGIGVRVKGDWPGFGLESSRRKGFWGRTGSYNQLAECRVNY